ncbi:MAG: phosphatase PAP2 family protein [Deltaproteobacteria bacterium]
MKINLISRLTLLFVSLGFVFFLNSCTDETVDTVSSELAKTYDASVVLAWNDLLVDIDRYSPGYRPPAAARMMAYTGLAAYESIVPGMPEYNSLENNYSGLNLPLLEEEKEYYWPASVNAAYATMFRHFYPHIVQADKDKIDALENKFDDKFALKASDEVIARSAAFGKAVADAVFEYSKSDTYGHEAYKNPRPSDYIPPLTGANGEKLWQPTFPDYTPALFPYWGKVRPFAMKQGDLRGKTPLAYSEDPNSKFYLQANEVRLTVNTLTLEERWIAEFWSDDMFQVTFEPAARQIAIANQLVIDEKLSLDRAVELYAKLGMAMCDAGISIWYTKYLFNVMRPVQYIRSIIEPEWKSALNHPYNGLKGFSPEFPAYPSGHSGFGGSAALIFTDIFGNNYQFTDNCHKDRHEFMGTPRSYSSFIEAGMENAYSRIPLGVHYRMDCDEGLRLGYLAATRVLQLEWKK